MRFLTAAFLVTACISDVALAGHATPEDIKAAQQRIDALNREITTISQPLRGSGEVRVSVDRTLFDDLNAHLQSLPEARRSADLTILSAQGTFHNQDTSNSGLPFACGYEIKLNHLTGNARATLNEVQWASPGVLTAKAHVQGSFTGNVGLHLNAPPCPDIVCEIGSRRIEWEVCIPFVGCYKDYKDVPWPECKFRGWTNCDAHCLGGGIQVVNVGVDGTINENISMTMTPERLEPLDHPVAQIIDKKPGITTGDVAKELSIPEAEAAASFARLRDYKLLDGGNLTDAGKAYAPGAGVGFAFKTAGTAKIPLHLEMKIPVPWPENPFKWFCDKIGGDVCKFLVSINLPRPPDMIVRIDDLITLCNLSFCIKDPVDYPAIEIPPLLPGAVPLYGMGDTLVEDAGNPDVKVELPTTGRPIRAEGFATNLITSPDNITVEGATNIGWMDIERWIDRMQMHFVDVGKGDTILIRMPRRIAGQGGSTILIDGGPNRDDGGIYAERNRAGRYLQFFNIPLDGTVDTVLVTHPHYDHYAGLLDFLRNSNVRRLVVSGRGSWAPGYRRLLSLARGRGIQIVDASITPISEIVEGVQFDVLHAYDKDGHYGFFETATSNASIVARLRYREHTFLFSGDALGRKGNREPRYVEADLLATPGPAGIDATVLKLGDHGSDRVAGERFLSAVSPDVVVISAGRETSLFGGYAPTQSTLARIQRVLPGATVVSTAWDDQALHSWNDYDGDDVLIMTNGHGVMVWQSEPDTGGKRNWRLRRHIGPNP